MIGKVRTAAPLFLVLCIDPARTALGDEDPRGNEARKACLAGDVEKGIKLLADYFTDTEDVTALFNMGRCFQLNGNPAMAELRFKEYLRKATGLSAESRAEAEAQLRDVEAAQRSASPKTALASPGPRNLGRVDAGVPAPLKAKERPPEVQSVGRTAPPAGVPLSAPSLPMGQIDAGVPVATKSAEKPAPRGESRAPKRLSGTTGAVARQDMTLPAEIDSLMTRAAEADAADDHESALELAKRAVATRSSAALQRFLAGELVHLGRLDEAMDAARICIQQAKHEPRGPKQSLVRRDCEILVQVIARGHVPDSRRAAGVQSHRQGDAASGAKDGATPATSTVDSPPSDDYRRHTPSEGPVWPFALGVGVLLSSGALLSYLRRAGRKKAPTATPAARDSKIFLSYRRSDTPYEADRIASVLRREFGADDVFQDVDDIPVGMDFRQLIEEQIATCAVLVAVIGPQWARRFDGKQLLEDPDDFVGIELAAARALGKTVMPVMVRGTPSPSQQSLPEALSWLAGVQGISVRPHRDFDRDMLQLVDAIRTSVKTKKGQRHG
jgi:hypothetical protein